MLLCVIISKGEYFYSPSSPHLARKEDGVMCRQSLADLDIALLCLLQSVFPVLLVRGVDLVCYAPQNAVLVRDQVFSTGGGGGGDLWW